MSHVQKAHEVSVDNILVLLSLDINPIAVVCDTCIVYKSIDVLAKLVNCCLYESFTVLILAYVSSYYQGFNLVLFLDLSCEIV